MTHIFGKHYGWTLEYVRSMTAFDALSMMQEIRAQAEQDEINAELNRTPR